MQPLEHIEVFHLKWSHLILEKIVQKCVDQVLIHSKLVQWLVNEISDLVIWRIIVLAEQFVGKILNFQWGLLLHDRSNQWKQPFSDHSLNEKFTFKQKLLDELKLGVNIIYVDWTDDHSAELEIVNVLK